MARQRRREWSTDRGSPEPIPASILARLRHAGQRAGARFPPLPDHPYAFLVGVAVDRATLERAEDEARRCGAATHDILLAAGWVSEADYAAALAGWLGVPWVSWEGALDLAGVQLAPGMAAGLPARINGQPCHVLSATGSPPDALMLQVAALRARGLAPALAPRSVVETALERLGRQVRIEHAVRGLLRERPSSSARTRAAAWQPAAVALLIGLAIGGLLVLPGATLAAMTALMAVPFLCVTLLRLAALRETVSGGSRAGRRGRNAGRLPDAQLPLYTVLVPLFREVKVLPGLVAALRALDYPPAKLEIILVVEEVDVEMQAALLALALPASFRMLVVPKHEPQTKPKALNYALQFARGDFVVVYDAEDRPEPDQLRRALDLFGRVSPKIGCLQAQLNIYNPTQSWLTRGIMAQTPQGA
jgi:glycosyltransferase XagB